MYNHLLTYLCCDHESHVPWGSEEKYWSIKKLIAMVSAKYNWATLWNIMCTKHCNFRKELIHEEFHCLSAYIEEATPVHWLIVCNLVRKFNFGFLFAGFVNRLFSPLDLFISGLTFGINHLKLLLTCLLVLIIFTFFNLHSLSFYSPCEASCFEDVLWCWWGSQMLIACASIVFLLWLSRFRQLLHFYSIIYIIYIWIFRIRSEMGIIRFLL